MWVCRWNSGGLRVINLRFFISRYHPFAMSTPTVLPSSGATAVAQEPASVAELFASQLVRSEALRREPVESRARRLRALAAWVTENRAAIQQALLSDFRKPIAETDVTEIWPTQTEIKHTLRHLKQWT